MDRFVILIALFFLLHSVAQAGQSCPLNDSLWNSYRSSSVINALIKNADHFDNDCFYEALNRLCDDPLVSHFDSVGYFVNKWALSHEFDYQILFACFHNQKIKKNRIVWTSILSAVKHKNGSPYDMFTVLVNAGKPAQADTVFLIFDNEGKLGTHDWLRWAKVKSLIGNGREVAGLYCRTIRTEPNLTLIALNLLLSHLSEMPIQTADSVLTDFRRCSFSEHDDAISIDLWIADTYSKLGLFKQELEVLKNLDDRSLPGGKRILSAARNCFSRNHFFEAIEAAKIVYEQAGKSENRSAAAGILYQSFLALGKKDSAVAWLNRADFSVEKNRVDAIRLYQDARQFSGSQGLIDSLPVSLSRDTLNVRQLLFTGEKKKALKVVTESIIIRGSEMHFALWNTRTLLYDGQVGRVVEYMKTLKINPHWECAGELLGYQYWIKRLASSAEALNVWSKIEYHIYTATPEKAHELLSGSRISAELKWRLALYAGKVLIADGAQSTALEVLNAAEVQDVSPEYLYYKGVALYNCGFLDNAQQILSNVVMDHSTDVFAERARLFLADPE